MHRTGYAVDGVMGVGSMQPRSAAAVLNAGTGARVDRFE